MNIILLLIVSIVGFCLGVKLGNKHIANILFRKTLKKGEGKECFCFSPDLVVKKRVHSHHIKQKYGLEITTNDDSNYKRKGICLKCYGIIDEITPYETKIKRTKEIHDIRQKISEDIYSNLIKEREKLSNKK